MEAEDLRWRRCWPSTKGHATGQGFCQEKLAEPELKIQQLEKTAAGENEPEDSGACRMLQAIRTPERQGRGMLTSVAQYSIIQRLNSHYEPVSRDGG